MWRLLGRLLGIDEEKAEAAVMSSIAESMEEEAAADPTTPVRFLHAMAESEPRLRPFVRENPACPPELASWIDAQAE